MIRPKQCLITALAMRKQAMCPPPYPRARASSDPPSVLLPGVLSERLFWLGEDARIHASARVLAVKRWR